MSQTVSDPALPYAGDPSEQRVESRTCAEPDCLTVLSRYNSTHWCSVHTRRDWRASRPPRG